MFANTWASSWFCMQANTSSSSRSVRSGVTYHIPSDRTMTADTLTGSQGSSSAYTNTVTLLFLPACCFPPQVSGEEIPKATQPLPSETLAILLSANYLVVSDLVKWNWLLSAVCCGAATGNSHSPFLSLPVWAQCHIQHIAIGSWAGPNQ